MGNAVVIGMAVLSTPYYVIRHPRRTYRMLAHKVGWYV